MSKCPFKAWKGQKSSSPPGLCWWEWGAQLFHIMLSKYFLFCQVDPVVSPRLPLERASFPRGFLNLLLSWQLLSSKSVVREAKRKSRGAHCQLPWEPPAYMVSRLFSTFENLMFASRVMFRRDGEKYVYSIFQEAEVSTAYCITQ